MKEKEYIDAEFSEKENTEESTEEINDEVVEVEPLEDEEVVLTDSVKSLLIKEEDEPLPEGIHKRFKISEKVYLEYARFISKKRSLKTTIIAAVVIAVIVNFFFKTDSWLESLKYMGIYAGLYIVLTLGSSRLLTPRMMVKNYHKQGIGSLEFDVLIYQDGLIQKFEDGYLKLLWAEFVLVKETENAFFLAMANKRAILLPKEVLSGEEVVEIRNLLNANIADFANQLNKQGDK